MLCVLKQYSCFGMNCTFNVSQKDLMISSTDLKCKKNVIDVTYMDKTNKLTELINLEYICCLL